MADRLIVQQDKWHWRIVWEIEEDGSTDGHLGDMPRRELSRPAPKDREDAKTWYAEREAKAIYDEARKARDTSCGRDTEGFWWEEQSDARAALRRIKAAIKIGLSKRPWPQWAKDALKHGWRAPKGWQP